MSLKQVRKVAEYGRNMRKGIRMRSLIMVLIYCALLIAIIAVRLFWDENDKPPENGTLDGRYDSEITLSYRGDTLHYRDGEITNYLLIGIDREALGAEDFRSGGQADFLLILSINRWDRTVTPVMIDRDTMTGVTTYGIFGNPAGEKTMQICLAQAFSGLNVSGSRNTADAVSGLLHGVRIDRVLVMDLGGISELNDLVGGVTVTVEDDLTRLNPALYRGATVRLEGDVAEQFVRGRRTVADGTNASRMRRQNTYLTALVKRVSELAQTEEILFDRLFAGLSAHIETDVTENVLIREANACLDYEWQEALFFSGTHVTGEDGFNEFWIDEDKMTETVARIWFRFPEDL